MEEVELYYFYQIFRKYYENILKEKTNEKIALEKEEYRRELLRMFPISHATKEEILKAYNDSLFYVCRHYISLSNSKTESFSNNPFELVTIILDKIEENPYKDSLLISLQFIYQRYFYSLELGNSMAITPLNNDLQDSYMEVVWDSSYKIFGIKTVNMGLLEQTKIMTKFFLLQKNQQQGPLQKVKYRYCKDI